MMQSAFVCGTLAILCCFIWPAFAPAKKKNHVNPFPGVGTATSGVGGGPKDGTNRCKVCSPDNPECDRSDFCARMLNGGKGKCKCYPKPVPPEATKEATKGRTWEYDLAFYKEESDIHGPFWTKIKGTREMAEAVGDYKPLPTGSEAIRADFGFICWTREDKLVDGNWPGVERCT